MYQPNVAEYLGLANLEDKRLAQRIFNPIWL